MSRLLIEYLKPKDLKKYSKNSRTHSEEQVLQIMDSINQFGFVNPILIDEKSEIIAGHGRLEAAQKAKLETVPVIRLTGLDENQKKALRISDNQLPLNAGWDLEILAEEISLLKEDGFDLDVLGFDDDFLDDLLKGLSTDEEQPTEKSEKEDDCPSVDESKTVTQLGDVWILGNHRLMCGDSTEIKNVESLMSKDKASLFLTDPPYNVSYVGKTKDALTIQNDSMSDDGFRDFLRKVYFAADSVMNAGAVFYVWHADSEGYNFRGAAFDIGWKVRQCLIWNKNILVMGRQDYHWKHEPCLYGWKDGGSHFWGSDRKQTTVLDFNRPTRNAEHPTMKPVELFQYSIENSSRKNDVVLDLFGGSGTTMIACEKTKRKSRLMELDPKYCDVIIKRWQEFTGKEAVKEKDNTKFNDMV